MARANLSQARPRWAPAATLLLGALVFAFDTWSPLGIAVAVLYGPVVLLSASFLGRRGVIVVAAVCAGLAIGSFLVGHAATLAVDAVARCGVSLGAIAVTTLLVLRNLTALDALRRQAALLDLTHDAINVTDRTGRITYWNGGAETLYGWPAREAIGHEAEAILRSRPEPPAPAAERWEGELARTRRDGTGIEVASRLSVQRSPAGEVVAVMETSNDITARNREARDRIRAEEDLGRARAELSHITRVTTLGELAASIAHEVNQPLAAAVTNGEAGLRWLSREPPNVEALRQSLDRAVANARRASEVIARLRALARRSEPEHVRIDLNAAVEEVLALLRREIDGHGVRLVLDLDPATPAILGDRVQLQQVVINLAMNAAQAMEGLGVRRLDIRTRPSTGGARLEVSDTGPGWRDGDVEAPFAPFATSKAQGLGMGLAICRTIVEAHGGSIRASASDTGGARLLIELPAAEEQP